MAQRKRLVYLSKFEVKVARPPYPDMEVYRKKLLEEFAEMINALDKFKEPVDPVKPGK